MPSICSDDNGKLYVYQLEMLPLCVINCVLNFWNLLIIIQFRDLRVSVRAVHAVAGDEAICGADLKQQKQERT